ncbi:hypothetical protein [Saccharothrix variisporea]|uniref:Uncharacterized protein n=1 Tax=Saccharothrix variisporea TaxID=543527 RepID=A0A495XL80_9PSEU|nr:hypothetical protein [Saccharothrix variisporea]RKT74642.1 hypothetical protein DFJ66_8009 [Saccharothrix variisporea]
MRERFSAYLRRTEGRLTLIAALTTVSTIVLGLVGMTVLRDRQALLDDAVDRRGALTSAALDIYRTFADADATSLDAVLVDQQRSPALQRKFREDVFDAVDALREAASRDPGGSSSERVRRLTDLVPQYVQLVEVGWSASRDNHPVGTSYLSQASFLVRDTILKDADALRGEQIKALTEAQRDASEHAWSTYLLGVVVLFILYRSQRFLFARTRRKVNLGLLAATALTVIAVLWLPIALLVSSGNAEDSIVTRERVVAPLAEARNVGRSADGNEARILIYPAVGDIDALKTDLGKIAALIEEAEEFAGSGPDRDRVDQAASALRSWTEADTKLIKSPDEPLTYPETVALVTPPAGDGKSYAEQVDEHLTAAISGYTRSSAESTASARAALDGLDVVFALLMGGAAVTAVAGMWPRIAEYYR